MLASCRALAAKPEWKAVCAAAGLVDGADAVAVRKFFEQYFVPHQLRNPDGSTQGLVTGYFEPLLRGQENAEAFSRRHYTSRRLIC